MSINNIRSESPNVLTIENEGLNEVVKDSIVLTTQLDGQDPITLLESSKFKEEFEGINVPLVLGKIKAEMVQDPNILVNTLNFGFKYDINTYKLIEDYILSIVFKVPTSQNLLSLQVAKALIESGSYLYNSYYNNFTPNFKNYVTTFEDRLTLEEDGCISGEWFTFLYHRQYYKNVLKVNPNLIKIGDQFVNYFETLLTIILNGINKGIPFVSILNVIRSIFSYINDDLEFIDNLPLVDKLTKFLIANSKLEIAFKLSKYTISDMGKINLCDQDMILYSAISSKSSIVQNIVESLDKLKVGMVYLKVALFTASEEMFELGCQYYRPLNVINVCVDLLANYANQVDDKNITIFILMMNKKYPGEEHRFMFNYIYLDKDIKHKLYHETNFRKLAIMHSLRLVNLRDIWENAINTEAFEMALEEDLFHEYLVEFGSDLPPTVDSYVRFEMLLINEYERTRNDEYLNLIESLIETMPDEDIRWFLLMEGGDMMAELKVKVMIKRNLFGIKEIDDAIVNFSSGDFCDAMLKQLPYNKYPENIINYFCTLNDASDVNFSSTEGFEKLNKLLVGLVENGYPITNLHVMLFESSKDNIEDLEPVDIIIYNFIKANAVTIDLSPIDKYIQEDNVDNYILACRKFCYYPREDDLEKARLAGSTKIITVINEINVMRTNHSFYFESRE